MHLNAEMAIRDRLCKLSEKAIAKSACMNENTYILDSDNDNDTDNHDGPNSPPTKRRTKQTSEKATAEN